MPLLPDLCDAPDAIIQERLIDTGRLPWPYLDFPLQQHSFARLAAHSVACADEQGKYWEQHDRIYRRQQDRARVRDVGPLFQDYARGSGLDLGEAYPLNADRS